MEYRIVPGRLEIGKFSLYYESVGSGPALIFLHGLGGDHLSWWQQVPHFMRWYRCVTLDQRSFGFPNEAGPEIQTSDDTVKRPPVPKPSDILNDLPALPTIGSGLVLLVLAYFAFKD